MVQVSQIEQQQQQPRNEEGEAVDQVNRNYNQVWGNLSSEEICQTIINIYDEVVHWRKNIFKVLSGAAGKKLIKEITKLICIWNEEKHPLDDIALKMVMIGRLD